MRATRIGRACQGSGLTGRVASGGRDVVPPVGVSADGRRAQARARGTLGNVWADWTTTSAAPALAEHNNDDAKTDHVEKRRLLCPPRVALRYRQVRQTGANARDRPVRRGLCALSAGARGGGCLAICDGGQGRCHCPTGRGLVRKQTPQTQVAPPSAGAPSRVRARDGPPDAGVYSPNISALLRITAREFRTSCATLAAMMPTAASVSFRIALT
jgi:hypothetical protein